MTWLVGLVLRLLDAMVPFFELLDPPWHDEGSPE